MQLTNTPGKLVLPFANAGAKNTIPTASQIGITAGAASLTDGFPPLTRTPIAAGGVPPSGLDMNGILYELSAILRWANAGGGYAYDAAFATDSNVGGYPKGARIMRSDGLGYWFNTVENNTTDPEGAGAIAAGWVPDFTTGAAAVTMTGANVTLTAAQYGKPIIVITGLLTANLNLIFPSIVGEWTAINNTTGPYTITCKTAAGTGVVVNSVQAIVGDGTNIYSAVNDAISLLGENVAHAGGTADALTAAFTPAPHSWPDGVPFFVRASAANTTTAPTFAPDGLTAKTIVKGNNLALAAGDIAGAGHWLEMNFDTTLDKWVLQNPAFGVSGVQFASDAEAQAFASAMKIISPYTLGTAFKGANQSTLETGFQKLPGDLILQWGKIAEASRAIEGITFPITFPLAFPNAILNAGATVRPGDAVVVGAVDGFATVRNTSNSSMDVISCASVGGTIVYGIYWFAIGY